MYYRIKLNLDAILGPLYNCMAHKGRSSETSTGTESKFYLPVGISPSSKESRVDRIWTALFNHRV